jgi:3-mercaptopyruvate sulfurtransferase SseA
VACLGGARQLKWEAWSGGHEGPQLKPRAELRTLLDEHAKDADSVVTYCWVGYKASATMRTPFAAKKAAGLVETLLKLENKP